MNNKENKLVSVIIPTYNREKLLMRAIESVLSQDYKQIEVIVVDDGSTDGTSSLFMKQFDERVHYVRNRHEGANYARNTGIELSKGEYISFLDSDDTYRPNKISKQLSQIQLSQSDMVFCSFDRHINRFVETITNKIENNSVISYSQLLSGNFISTQTIFAKAEILKKEMFDEKLTRFQDWDLVLRLAKDYKICYFDDILVDQYIQPDSIFNKKQNYIDSMIQIILKNYESYIDNSESLRNILINIIDFNKKQ